MNYSVIRYQCLCYLKHFIGVRGPGLEIGRAWVFGGVVRFCCGNGGCGLAMAGLAEWGNCTSWVGLSISVCFCFYIIP